MSETNFAAILAGGKSRRMGFDKTLAISRGETLLSRTARIAWEAGLSVCIVGRAAPAGWAREDIPFLQDRWAGTGPMGGIATALLFAQKPVAAIACDMPALSAPAIAWLIGEARARTLACGLAAVGDCGPEPLFSIYTPACLPAMLSQIENGELSLQSLIRAGGFTFAQMPRWVARAVANMNTPDDLALLEAPGGSS